MKKIIIPFCFLLLASGAFAQQIGMYNHYFYKPMIYNPAFTGNGDGANILLVHRTQWADFKGAPQFDILTLDNNFMNKKVGLGMGLTSDKKGINNTIAGNLFYSYKISFNDNTHLALGLSFGIINQTLNYSKAVVETAVDPALFSDSRHKTTYDGNAGLAFFAKGLEFGLAIPQLFANKIKYADSTKYAQVRHYMGSLKYKIFLSEDKGMYIAPQVLVRFVPNTPLQYDGNINFNWNDKFWIGATYKSNYAIAAHVGLCIHKLFAIGYSYDIITGSLGKYSGISHEIMLNIKFGKNKKDEPKPVEEESPKVETKAPEPEPIVVQQPPKIENKIPPVTDTKTPEVETKPLFDDAAYRKHISDSLNQLRLQEEQDKLKQNQQDAKNKNSEAIQNNASKTMDNTVWIATNKVRDFKDAGNQSPKKGFYVVIGSFHTREFAQAEVKRLIIEGLKETNWIYFEPGDFNYVFIKRVDTKEEAFKQANNAKVAGYEDVWIQLIVEE
ncbi:MAG: PorP/SprF family type IX secretion system membrane protein [Bacteroidetes bacterium]|nr:PorP/SprF family type IX secretion system membrane protein [Bacteroidota bacterium]